MVRFIDWNERRHRVEAQHYLKENSRAARQCLAGAVIHQHRLAQESVLRQISQRLVSERQQNRCRATSIALTDLLLLVGTSTGEL